MNSCVASGIRLCAPFGYLGFGKRQQTPTPAQQYLREKAALMATAKYYTPEEFEQLLADVSNGLVTVRIYVDGIVIERPGRR